MARLPYSPPPGVYRDGTAYQSKGRWFDALHVRWYGSALGPTLGWRQKGVSTVTGMARSALTWPDSDGNTWIGIGTHSNWYVCDRIGGLYDITPPGFVVGNADAVASGGYGTGPYGSIEYGTPRPDTTTTIEDATEWTQAKWGEDLLGVAADRKIYEWVAPTVATPGAQVVNSPLCDAVCVTEEGFVFALATSNPYTLEWCDQRDNTVWTPSDTNQAGNFELDSSGRLMCGVGVSGATLLLTSKDAHLATFEPGVDVYGFRRVGRGCGVISRQGVAVFGTGQAVWMAPDVGFWLWNGGAVVPLQCDLLDYIRQDINLVQASKVVLVANAANSEIEIRYPSGDSIEIDRCVILDFKAWTWNIGRAARTCGVDKGADLFYPVYVSAAGVIYDHEVGWDYDGDEPFATTGPLQLGNNDNIMHLLGMYPDDAVLGDVNVSFTTQRDPDNSEASYGPYTLAARTNFRFAGSLVKMTITGVEMTSWRFGTGVLEVMPGEGR